MWDPYAEFQSATLPNGLEVHAAHWPGRPWETMGFLVHSGSEQDTIGFDGTAHFVEHMVSKSISIKYEEIINFFEDCGADFQLGSTDDFRTQFNFFVPLNRVNEAVNIFGQMLFESVIEDGIEEERSAIIRELRDRFPTDLSIDLFMRIRKAIFHGFWLERSLGAIGMINSIQAINYNVLQDYYQKHYTPLNISIVGVGGLTLGKLVEILSQSPFGAIKEGTRTPIRVPLKDVSYPIENHFVFKQSEYITGSPIDFGGYHTSCVIPGVLSFRASQVFRDMLWKELINYIRGNRSWTYQLGVGVERYGYFHSFSISPGSLDLEALKEIEEFINRCVEGIDKEELFEKARKSILAQGLLLDPSGSSVCDNALTSLTNFHRIISNSERTEDFEKVTIDDIRDLLPWLVSERRYTLITQP